MKASKYALQVQKQILENRQVLIGLSSDGDTHLFDADIPVQRVRDFLLAATGLRSWKVASIFLFRLRRLDSENRFLHLRCTINCYIGTRLQVEIVMDTQKWAQ